MSPHKLPDLKARSSWLAKDKHHHKLCTLQPLPARPFSRECVSFSTSFSVSKQGVDVGSDKQSAWGTKCRLWCTDKVRPEISSFSLSALIIRVTKNPGGYRHGVERKEALEASYKFDFIFFFFFFSGKREVQTSDSKVSALTKSHKSQKNCHRKYSNTCSFVNFSLLKNDQCHSSIDGIPSTDGKIWCLKLHKGSILSTSMQNFVQEKA